jgi:hypothetical protein
MKKNIYINSIRQISAQKPLSDEWFDNPIVYDRQYVRAIDADYGQYFTPNEARRLSKILKRALLVSREARMCVSTTPLMLDAIITGTGLGCIENTEIFLRKLVCEGEELLNPTYFMNSTHNTVSSLVAIDAKCHNYNTTYAHKGISFECALQDAFLQMTQRRRDGKLSAPATALVGAHDEMTPAYFTLLKKAGYFGNENQVFAGETAVAMVLGTEKSENALCRIENVGKIYGTTGEGLHLKPGMTEGVDYVMTGVNGNLETERIYFENCRQLFPGIPLLQYKNIFGESYTAPAFSVYASALCLQKGKIPEHLRLPFRRCGAESSPPLPQSVQKIMCFNQFENKNRTFILLSKC